MYGNNTGTNMAVKRINGIELEQMLRNGLANLRASEDEINRLNVFPVPDGDTGTNMVKTLEHGLSLAERSGDVNVFTKSLASGMLLGARGNSGVILSQFFYGFSQALSRALLIGPGELRNALVRGYRVAYGAVMKPVEGTILSVAREGIEHIRSQITRGSTIDFILSAYVAEMRKTLVLTPEMLPVLKDAGVVDSGATGYILIFEGMVKYLNGEVLEDTAQRSEPKNDDPDLGLFNEDSVFVDGYCMEFILQRMNGSAYEQDFRLKTFAGALDRLGDSVVCVQDGKRVKVHIHTKAPSVIIELAQRYGEFLTFKLENMQIQHNERDRVVKPAVHKPLSVVAVVNGAGMRKLFEGLGADCVLDADAAMNTSAQEFVSAFDSLDADEIVVLPNNKNIILAAEQAASLVPEKRVTVLPSRSFAEGYYAIAMDIPDEKDLEKRIRGMRSGIDNIVTLRETTASRDYTYHEIRCRRGEDIAFLGGELVCVERDWKAAILGALAMIEDIDDRETGIVLRGAGVSASDEEALAEAIAGRHPMLGLEFVDAGQEVYRWEIGIM